MAIGGTGDTLAGIITGFLAQFTSSVDVISAAVYLHSYIADQIYDNNYIVLPTKISQALPYWMKQFEN
ncbi:NAD(P)HX dehydratase [Tetragenococcus muriaticus 3MR10-3]|uniref:NAD(P)HX dehydratase n=2 Tax=Tetragenococcus muriaticus TaxID=64642 RepID=A0A091C9H5_9ENTE|nr:NAD(P)HX dehydratase [Tetragenococcus muriaticus 3MR10-3]